MGWSTSFAWPRKWEGAPDGGPSHDERAEQSEHPVPPSFSLEAIASKGT